MRVVMYGVSSGEEKERKMLCERLRTNYFFLQKKMYQLFLWVKKHELTD
jgi:hypothetical protein